MRYRGVADRRVSAYVALLVITIFASGATLLIVHVSNQVSAIYDAEIAADELSVGR